MPDSLDTTASTQGEITESKALDDKLARLPRVSLGAKDERPLTPDELRQAMALTQSDVDAIKAINRDPTYPASARAKLYALRLAHTLPSLPQSLEVKGATLETLILTSMTKSEVTDGEPSDAGGGTSKPVFATKGRGLDA